jgi:hypothetical protein
LAARESVFGGERGKIATVAFERVVPERSACGPIETPDLTMGRGQYPALVQDDVDEIGAFEFDRPHDIAVLGIQRDD